MVPEPELMYSIVIVYLIIHVEKQTVHVDTFIRHFHQNKCIFAVAQFMEHPKTKAAFY